MLMQQSPVGSPALQQRPLPHIVTMDSGPGPAFLEQLVRVNMTHPRGRTLPTPLVQGQKQFSTINTSSSRRLIDISFYTTSVRVDSVIIIIISASSELVFLLFM